MLRVTPPGDSRLDPVAYATAAAESRVFSSEHATVSELHLPDADLPARMATRTSLLMQVSAPIVVELLRNGRYEKCVMKPGAFCIAPVGPVPAARWHGQRSILVLELSQWLLNSVAEANDVLRIELQAGSAVDDPQIAYLLLALRADLASSSPSGRAYVDAISRAVAYRLLMAHGVSPSPRPSRGGLSQRSLRRVLEFIDAHLDRDLPLKSMADISGLSVDHFARAFRESTGEPPHRYLLLRRLLRAKLLLEHSEVPIVEIAQMVGFADQSHLTNNLRRYLGTTPRKLRAEWTGPEDSAGILQ